MRRFTQAAPECASLGPASVRPLAPMKVLSTKNRSRKAMVSAPVTIPS
jgi:hypothetical protein